VISGMRDPLPRLAMTRWLIGLASLFATVAVTTAAEKVANDSTSGVKGADPVRIVYDREIRPLLSDACYKCHGPDGEERKAGLRLDLKDSALKPGESGQVAVVPGKPAESELIRRILSDDPNEIMPPPDSGKKLTAAQKDLIKRWVEQGADYQQHWSFVAPVRPPLPKVNSAAWPRNALDHFILARLEREKLQPSNEANKTTLIRRATLDLTGLPPTPAEIDAFLADSSPQAYEKVVDRLLASPHFGERMAVDWLDASRYADTHGYHIDSGRDMSHWREWVIAAFNRNLPFDQFTIQQLAGDLLPDATIEQKVASGFNRNHMINFEGGAIPAEYQTAYIVDRVNTTGTVWLGLSVACSQCHDHKYDPITQKDFYKFYAFFNNLPENGLDGRDGNAVPLLKMPSSEQQRKLDQLTADLKPLEAKVNSPSPAIDAAQADWEKTAIADQKIEWSVLDPTGYLSQGGATLTRQADKSLLASGVNPATETYTIVAATDLSDITALRLEALPDESLPQKSSGRSANGNVVLTEVNLTAGLSGDLSTHQPVKFQAATADFSQTDFPIANAIDGKSDTGWAIYPEVTKPHAAVFTADKPIRTAGKTLLTVTLHFQSQFAQHQLGRFRLSVTQARNPHGAEKLPKKIADSLALAADKRSDAQKTELRDHYRKNVSPELKQAADQLAALKKSLDELNKQIPNSMVMQENPQPRDTFMLIRGQYDKPGEKVTAGVPGALSRLPEGAPANRLGLAQWLVDADQPLTARVIVNRYWQMYFGTGIVKTAEDFGSQGEYPSHPELLDWLATEFRESGWDVKHLQRLIVTSATYRQNSSITPALVAKDPENRLLARGPRMRLQAEFIRDQALAVSGLLNDQIGGQSVLPYQPAGLWEEMAFGREFSAQKYVQSTGRDLYRRTMYTFWKRTVPPASLSTFDAPDRETCIVRRSRTNTPLQALVLMNDPTYVEASRKLAERMMTEASVSPEERIAFAFRLATARLPKPAEAAVLTRIFQQQLAVFQKDAAAAQKLLSVGESKRNEKLDAAELAAWTTIASVILNLDETITKG
jgi:hypothetical protein